MNNTHKIILTVVYITLGIIIFTIGFRFIPIWDTLLLIEQTYAFISVFALLLFSITVYRLNQKD